MSDIGRWIASGSRIPEKFRPRWSSAEIRSAQTLLSAIDGVLVTRGIPYCLICGSLLGSQRHKGVIPWDDDIDITCYEKHMTLLPRLFTTFLKMNILIYLHPKDLTIVVRWRDREFPYVDIFPWRRLSDEVVRSFGHRTKYYTDVPMGSWLPFRRTEFEGLNLYAPNDPTKFLDRKYPNWRKRAITGEWDHREHNARKQELIGEMPWEELRQLAYNSAEEEK